MKAIIVDDEQLARQIVREFLSHHPEIEIVAECPNGFEAVKAITELKPDILFLDIQMPKLSGFEVLELIDHDVTVIFTTAYDEFALKAFEVHAADYLLKPFSRERFDEALEQTKKRIPDSTRLDAIAEESASRTKPLERILVRDGAKVHIIPIESIDYIEAQDDYVSIKTEGKSILKQARLSALEQQLDEKKFIRIHRSYILNIERLAKIEPYAKDSRVAILADGTRLQVSRAGYARLKIHL
ncbi:MAG: LytTR family transcriptional regulator DNA-binding domain-containing protein [Bacteroidetes bacterium]|nr:LytTR family transcriptional regulator DNA-binding domain-containing protein [Bacteroidota bacterium]MCW5896587.1 LytTR family transcriptional regulator DNA-binding domain-containing protein [Bacteroidota bacterium]